MNFDLFNKSLQPISLKLFFGRAGQKLSPTFPYCRQLMFLCFQLVRPTEFSWTMFYSIIESKVMSRKTLVTKKVQLWHLKKGGRKDGFITMIG
jgi:hypothetical protein